MKGDYQKLLKKLTLFFISNPVLFNGQSYKKQKGLGTSNQSLFRLQNKFTKISILVKYYQTKFDGVIQIGSWVIPKITPLHLCKPIHKLFHFHLLFWIWKVWKGSGKITNFEYLENEKRFLDIWKTFFTVFEGLSYGEKI